jgi:CheY-like chemotaxis protein
MSRILVVDDDASIRETIRIALTSAGMDVVAVDCGERAIETMSSAAFDCAIVDLMMPGMDGLETVQALRANAPGLPAVLISGALMRADPHAPDFLSMGCRLPGVTRLAKPFTLAELLRTVRACVAVAA